MATKPKATPKPSAPQPSWHVETFTSRRALRQRHYFRLMGANGETLAESEGYARAVDRTTTAHLVADSAGADIRPA